VIFTASLGYYEDMSAESRYPKSENIAKRFVDLERTAQMAAAVLEVAHHDPDQERTVEQMIYEGYDELISLFNVTDGTIHAEIMPKFTELKSLLGDVPLPRLDEIGAKDLVRGIRASNYLMIAGQDNALRTLSGENVTQEEKENAIGAPSVGSNAQAIAVGSAGHLVERSIMAYAKRNGIDTSGWVKDQVLWALEELALLAHAKIYTYGERPEYSETLLYPYFTHAPSMDADGGMGWRNEEQVDEFCDAYQRIESEARTGLLETYQEWADTYELPDIETLPFEEILNTVTQILLENGVEPEEWPEVISGIEGVDD